MMTPAAPKEQQQILSSGVSTHVSAHVLCVVCTAFLPAHPSGSIRQNTVTIILVSEQILKSPTFDFTCDIEVL